MGIKEGIAKFGSAILKHSPEILTAIGIVGFITAGIKAVKNTPKALEKIKEAEESVEVEEPLTNTEKVKLCWKFYIVPIIITIISIICILLAKKVTDGRMAALVTACKFSEETAERFIESTREVAGDKTVAKIEDKIAEKDISQKKVVDDEIYQTKGGDSLYYECYSGRYFRSSRDFIDKANNKFNAGLLDYDTMTINDWLECLDLPYIDNESTGDLGWRVDDVRNKCGGNMPKVVYSTHMASNGEPCSHIKLEVIPTSGYSCY